MKCALRLFLVSISIISFCTLCFSQNVFLTTQIEADLFDASTTSISGDLTISGSVVDLSNLSNLNSIGGRLWIRDNSLLTDVSGLENLTSVGDELLISNNLLLANLNGLTNLNAISSFIRIEDNAALIDLSGFTSLTTIGGDFSILNNSSLISTTGFTELTILTGFLKIENNPVLENIDGFANITTIQSSLNLVNNNLLNNINGFTNLTAIGATLLIDDNDSLIDLEGLNSLTTIPGHLKIKNNDALQNMNSLNNLSAISGEFLIENNNALTNLNGFLNLNEVGFFLDIINNNNLLSIDGLNNLQTVGKHLGIRNNALLTIISGFENLISVVDYVEVRDNSTISTITGFASISYLNGFLSIRNNESLIEVDGFNNLTSIGEYLLISNNELLTNLGGFSSINSLDKLTISNNSSLLNLMDFINLTALNNLEILNNSSLINLNGLTNLNAIGIPANALGRLQISENSSLSDMSGLINLTAVYGSIIIESNQVLNNLNGLTNIVQIARDLVIKDNDDLLNVDGLLNVNSVSGNVEIKDNLILAHLEGLINITAIGGNLEVINNFSLSTIDGLQNIPNRPGFLAISTNESITNLDAFNDLASISGDLSIVQNNSLNDCCGIQHLLQNQALIDGNVTISNNPSECSSEIEILSASCPNMFISINRPCMNADNGSIQVQMTAVSSPFSYMWELPNGQTGDGINNNLNFSIENLAAGSYNLTVTDAVGLEFIEHNIDLIPLPGSLFEILAITSTNSSNGFNNGAIEVTVAGGVFPYTFSWSGVSSGTQNSVNTPNFNIPNLAQGEYNIIVVDDLGIQQTVSVSLLDEIVPIFPCTQPLDIVILNDVSGSVDAIEYNESKAFFADFLAAANIGTGADESRAAIIEWSSQNSQSVEIPITDDLSTLQNYVNNSRAFSGLTSPHQALIFGEQYLADNVRPDVAKILILSTDGSGGQISPSLIGLADQLKADGYHIVTVAFDAAFANTYTREILQQVASINLLAPGAPAYSQLDQDLAENIVNLYLCPIDPGSSATAYFNRDGAIDIIGIEAIGGCPMPNNVQITFTIEALRELSIPSGTPVTFYHNNPALFGATSILTWQVPCAIAAGTTESFTVTLPVTTAVNIFAIFNDDGNQSPPIEFPITDIEELAYSNNIADTTICIDPLPTLQTFKYTTTPQPICNDIVIYTVNVCNISGSDATEVVVTDAAPTNFVLLNTVVNDNGCATNNNGNFGQVYPTS